MVYAKPPFGGSQQVLEYLGRYTHRVALSNQRILAVDGSQVTFQWKDYRHKHKQNSRRMTLSTFEFIRRFLIHTIPAGFPRIRYFGFLANHHRKKKLALCRHLWLTPSPVCCRSRFNAVNSRRSGTQNGPLFAQNVALGS